jgi:hypothetical protein
LNSFLEKMVVPFKIELKRCDGLEAMLLEQDLAVETESHVDEDEDEEVATTTEEEDEGEGEEPIPMDTAPVASATAEPDPFMAAGDAIRKALNQKKSPEKGTPVNMSTGTGEDDPNASPDGSNSEPKAMP